MLLYTGILYCSSPRYTWSPTAYCRFRGLSPYLCRRIWNHKHKNNSGGSFLCCRNPSKGLAHLVGFIVHPPTYVAQHTLFWHTARIATTTTSPRLAEHGLRPTIERVRDIELRVRGAKLKSRWSRGSGDLARNVRA